MYKKKDRKCRVVCFRCGVIIGLNDIKNHNILHHPKEFGHLKI